MSFLQNNFNFQKQPNTNRVLMSIILALSPQHKHRHKVGYCLGRVPIHYRVRTLWTIWECQINLICMSLGTGFFFFARTWKLDAPRAEVGIEPSTLEVWGHIANREKFLSGNIKNLQNWFLSKVKGKEILISDSLPCDLLLQFSPVRLPGCK